MERGRFTGQRLANYGQRSGEEVKREVVLPTGNNCQTLFSAKPNFFWMYYLMALMIKPSLFELFKCSADVPTAGVNCSMAGGTPALKKIALKSGFGVVLVLEALGLIFEGPLPDG
jgi:hypothetical protein